LEEITDADNQRATIIQKIQATAAKIAKCKEEEENYREQVMHYNSRQMVMKNREQEYMALLKQYSGKYEIASCCWPSG
jgi:predicted metalloendopeptidase